MNQEIRKIQLKCLEILEIVDKICREENIQYSLCGGSVVGAHLYKKCLPSDICNYSCSCLWKRM